MGWGLDLRDEKGRKKKVIHKIHMNVESMWISRVEKVWKARQ